MDNDQNNTQENSLLAAIDGDIRSRAGDLIDSTTFNICKYVNTIVGDAVIAQPDNEIRRIVTDLLFAFEERRQSAS